ncbi:MAG: GlmU family protein [Imperialibacter sp.]|uniref:GlmU family protein n=1 Tax=Imperialibacter sp. TaxID=2038411 RepID=UPI0032EAC240
MNIILFDDPILRLQLLPFTYTRPLADIRIGILKVNEKWQKLTGHKVSFLTENYLSAKFPTHFTSDNFYISGALCPTESLVQAVINLGEGEGLMVGDHLAALHSSAQIPYGELASVKLEKKVVFEGEAHLIDRPWRIFQWNGVQIRSDFDLVTAGRISEDITDPFTRVYNPENVFIEPGASIKSAIINAETGPVYIGKNAQIMEGAMIRGPFAMGEHSIIGMGAAIRENTTVGPYCKVSGEVSNAVFFGNSNKGHDGYLGNAVLGEWCNLGADTNASNLKNNYANVKVWSFTDEAFVDSGLQFCGLLMGDHSKCGINTMFNTGTVVGVSANIFGGGFPRSFVPSFTWGGSDGFATYRIEQALDTASRVLERRKMPLDETERAILMEVFERSAKFRSWEEE